MKLSFERIAEFQKKIDSYFEEHGRDLPWRKTDNPYHVLVSEIMLQQTQVDRVIPKYLQFIQQFPTIQSLASAPLSVVLLAWSGLGYNRRALYLQKACQQVLERFAGALPSDPADLIHLAGIGEATAASIAAFAFNLPTVFIETNIRSVFIHEFYTDRVTVDDEQIISLVEQTVDKKCPKRWYNALMDYGTHLKATYPNPSLKSAHHAKQPTFKGSDRQIRGIILKTLLTKKTITFNALKTILKVDKKRLVTILHKMLGEKLIMLKDEYVSIHVGE